MVDIFFIIIIKYNINCNSHYSSFQYHMILQESFYYADLNHACIEFWCESSP